MRNLSSLVIALALAGGACGADSTLTQEPTQELPADELLHELTTEYTALEPVASVVTLDASEDPLTLLAEDASYEAVAVIHDRSRPCDVPEIECGAILEVWPSERLAELRVEEEAALIAANGEVGYTLGIHAGRVALFVDPQVSDDNRRAYYDVVLAR